MTKRVIFTRLHKKHAPKIYNISFYLLYLHIGANAQNYKNMRNDKNEQEIDETFDIEGFDFGNLDVPDFDLDTLDILADDDREETRYNKPRAHNPHRMSFVVYNNAEKLAENLKLDKGERADAIIGGDFIFGDFIEAYITTHDIGCKKLTISTLSLNQNNVDSLRNLIDGGYVEELNLIVSVYFWSNERRVLIPYIYEKLDVADKFQLAVADIHTKTAQFETDDLGGQKIVIHGSANLRSSGNIEQFTIEENPVVYDFYDDVFNLIIDKYKTINKNVRRKALWDELTKRYKNI